MNQEPSKCTANSDNCNPKRQYSHSRELVDNLPYVIMILLGAVILYLGVSHTIFRYIAAGIYITWGAAGVLWIIIFLCPYCRFWNTRACPCGYGQIAGKFVGKKDHNLFKAKFRKNIPVIVPLWFIPVLAILPDLIYGFSWTLLSLVAAFIVDGFIILPIFSTRHGCADCEQKDDCPWMKNAAPSQA